MGWTSADHAEIYRQGFRDGYAAGRDDEANDVPIGPPKVKHELDRITLQSDGRKVSVCSCSWASKPAMLTATAVDRHWGHAAEAAAGILPSPPEPAPVTEKRDHWYPS